MPKVSVIIGGIVLGIVTLMLVLPQYTVYSLGMKGKALLKKAEQEKQIQIEQAKAEVESAKLRAEAIEIVGEAAKKYPEYRIQEFIGAFGEAMQNGSIQKIVYVPTESCIPLVKGVE